MPAATFPFQLDIFFLDRLQSECLSESVTFINANKHKE